MKLSDIKTIDVHGKEWFDRVNGNSYNSSRITINYGMADQTLITTPFQYGYGDFYMQAASQAIKERFNHEAKGYIPLWQFCQDNGIVLRYQKQERCLKREVVTHGNP